MWLTLAVESKQELRAFSSSLHTGQVQHTLSGTLGRLGLLVLACFCFLPERSKQSSRSSRRVSALEAREGAGLSQSLLCRVFAEAAEPRNFLNVGPLTVAAAVRQRVDGRADGAGRNQSLELLLAALLAPPKKDCEVGCSEEFFPSWNHSAGIFRP